MTIRRRNTTFFVTETAPPALQALAAELGLMTQRGPGAGQLGAGGQLLDRLAAASMALGPAIVALYLGALFDEHDRRWEESRREVGNNMEGWG